MNLKKTAASMLLLLTFVLLFGCVAAPSGSAEPSSSTTAPFDNTEPPGNSVTVPSDCSEPSSSTTVPSEATGQVDATRLSLQREIGENGYTAGMAFLGFVDEKATESDMRRDLKSSRYAEAYAFLGDAPLADAGGTELYAVVTATKECRVAVYRAQMTASGEYDVQTDRALYEGEGANGFLLRCNVSDIHANAVISFKNGDEAFSVAPMLSGMDGRLVAANCYDFSLYSETDGTEDKDVQIARELLTEASEVRERMAQGMTLLYTGEHQTIEGRDCRIFALGTNHEEQFVREFYYGVCDNLIYAYDALTDTWSTLGAERP